MIARELRGVCECAAASQRMELMVCRMVLSCVHVCMSSGYGRLVKNKPRGIVHDHWQIYLPLLL